jgi:hypothetical protein
MDTIIAFLSSALGIGLLCLAGVVVIGCYLLWRSRDKLGEMS